MLRPKNFFYPLNQFSVGTNTELSSALGVKEAEIAAHCGNEAQLKNPTRAQCNATMAPSEIAFFYSLVGVVNFISFNLRSLACKKSR